MYQYAVPTTEYVRYEFTTSASTSQSSSPPAHGYPYYTTQYKTPAASPTSRRPSTRHTRKESFSTPPKPAPWRSPLHPSPEYYATPEHYAAPRGAQPYLSSHGKSRRYSTSGRGGGGDGSRRYAPTELPKQHIVIDTSDEADDSPIYTFIKPRSNHHREKPTKTKTSPHFFYNPEPAYDDTSDSQPQRSRARRSSHTTKPRDSPPKPPKPKSPPKVATAADALKAGIPAGYSTKNWDPNEAPILLLGSVFDANSLGKWIYDWTVYAHSANAPIAEVAGDLWILLIKLAAKMRRGDEGLDRIVDRQNGQMVADFLASGDRLWGRLSDLLKICEEYMWRAATKGVKKGSVNMGKHTGSVFVDSIFGRDRELETTEGLMQSIRLWNMRFDANCEDILQHPSPRTRRRADR